jgi:hypothetical protein
MESIVGGAGGMGLLLRLSEAAEAWCGGLGGSSGGGGDDDDDDDDDPGGPPAAATTSAPLLLLRPRSPATAVTTTATAKSTFADGLAETARAFVPVALEFGAVAVVAKCFE